ncbi:hypothetical protein B0T11DRAFT_340603 [Plectosphaerella cucumerina]|uniref:Uncharacterized protein n=1 Tax=Plectosphaerella cucumerina TaxID=40658 RepID=A0A8K0X2Z8_9PEZI|nr:hypothetical protein B0T11DRAFT_340603 [Plectosphaerella cucumerina]
MASPTEQADDTINWPGLDEFVDIVVNRSAATSTLTVHNIPHDEIQRFIDLYEETLHRNIMFYDAQTKVGIFRIPSNDQVAAKSEFSTHLGMVIHNMRRDRLVCPSGSVLCQSADRTIIATPDTSLIPTNRLDEHPFPSVMVQVGRMQSRRSLMQIMRKWFRCSGGQVKIVVIINIIRGPPGRDEMVFQKWRCPEDEPVCDTAFSIKLRDDAPQPAPGTRRRFEESEFEVEVAPHSRPLPMVLEYELVCNEAPGPEQGDILMTEAMFRDMAVSTWLWFR